MREEHAIAGREPRACVKVVEISGGILREVRLPRESIGCPEFEGGNHGVFLEEIVVVDIDTGTGCPEHRPSAIGAELGGAVETSREVGEVDVVPGIVTREQEANEPCAAVAHGGLADNLRGIVGRSEVTTWKSLIRSGLGLVLGRADVGREVQVQIMPLDTGIVHQLERTVELVAIP